MAAKDDNDDSTGDNNERPQNPFAGTPMEQMFNAISGGGQLPDLNVLMQQMQQMFEPHEGTINIEVARDVARRSLAGSGDDPSPNSQQQAAVADAVQLAELWLDQATGIPAGATTQTAWSRAEWIESTIPTWHQLVEPIAEHVVGAMGQAIPEDAKAVAGPLLGIMAQAGGAMFSQQVGQALGGLASDVMSSTDVGVPLGPVGTAAILPAGVTKFGEGLEHSAADVMLYVTLRECAHHRLFSHASWLRSRLIGSIEEFGRGTSIDVDAIESRLQGIDPSRPEQLQEALSEGFFDPQRTPAQQAALDRLETLLALIEGWVDDVVTQATRDRMPSAISLAEAMRRRRAAGGPSEQTFASLVGLELRPRRMRDASTLWAAIRDRQDAQARDAVWAHPDLMPTAADLDDPMGFASGDDAEESTSSAEFDAALKDILDEKRPPE